MNESLVKYLAGLLDADGSMSFNFKRDRNREDRYFVGLRLTLVASDAIDKRGFVPGLKDITGMGSLLRDGDQGQIAVWAVRKRADVEMLVPRLVKHMVIKGQHWQWMLDQWRGHRRSSCGRADCEQLAVASKQSRKDRVGPLKPKNHPTWAWVAGYLDGDGCYSYRHYKYGGYQNYAIHVSAVAHDNDIHVLEFLCGAFGGLIRPQGQSEHLKIWKRNLGNQSRAFALRFLPNVAKHSRLKRHKIDQIIHHHHQRLSVPGTKVQATV